MNSIFQKYLLKTKLFEIVDRNSDALLIAQEDIFRGYIEGNRDIVIKGDFMGVMNIPGHRLHIKPEGAVRNSFIKAKEVVWEGRADECCVSCANVQIGIDACSTPSQKKSVFACQIEIPVVNKNLNVSFNLRPYVEDDKNWINSAEFKDISEYGSSANSDSGDATKEKKKNPVTRDYVSVFSRYSSRWNWRVYTSLVRQNNL